MSTSKNVPENGEVILEVFRAIERRDDQRFAALVHPDFEIYWPPSLPYGGTSRGTQVEDPQRRSRWTDTWDPLQPAAAERQMDPRIVATADEEVVVLWRQRGVSPAGERFDGEVLGLYHIREAKLARAQMFYFDTAALGSFLSDAKRQITARSGTPGDALQATATPRHDDPAPQPGRAALGVHASRGG